MSKGQLSKETFVQVRIKATYIHSDLLGHMSPWTKVSLDKSPLNDCSLVKSLLGNQILAKIAIVSKEGSIVADLCADKVISWIT